MLKSKSFNAVATIILTVIVIITLLPLALIVISSFAKESGCLLLHGKTGRGDSSLLWRFHFCHGHWYGRQCYFNHYAGLSDVPKELQIP